VYKFGSTYYRFHGKAALISGRVGKLKMYKVSVYAGYGLRCVCARVCFRSAKALYSTLFPWGRILIIFGLCLSFLLIRIFQGLKFLTRILPPTEFKNILPSHSFSCRPYCFFEHRFVLLDRQTSYERKKFPNLSNRRLRSLRL